jgi:site-specific DNA-cytosine methylase
MKRYVIERAIPGVGKMDRGQLKGAAVTSCDASAKLYGKIHWEHSYVTADKTFCIYLADGEATIREHARLSGFPANIITEVHTIIDPTTAFA